MTRVYLVRHGDTYFEADRRMKGQLDVPLSPVGRAQAAAVAAYLGGTQADVVYCSTLRRTQEGARLLAEAVGAPLRSTPLLDERGWGLWQGLTSAEIACERAAGRTGRDGFGPLGEPADEFDARVACFMRLLAASVGGRTVIVVTHGGVLKSAVLPALGLSVRDRRAFTAETGTITLLQYDGARWRPVFLSRSPAHAPECQAD